MKPNNYFNFGIKNSLYIAHDSRDDWFITLFGLWLKSFNSNVCIDHCCIDPGQNFHEWIRSCLIDATEIVVFLTPNSIESRWVEKEATLAWLLNKNVIVVSHNLQPKKAAQAFDGIFSCSHIIPVEQITFSTNTKNN